MRIAVATGGRFHALDLARELDALGHEVTFYSYVPRSRARKFGLPARCQVSLLPVMAPFLLAERFAASPLARSFSRWNAVLLDHVVALALRRCDVLVAMSGIFVKTLRIAKQKYAATVILERGSRHVLSQDRILRAMLGGKGVDGFFIRRELAGYEIADFISVPSRHVADSFLEFGVPEHKLLLNPYGCDLNQFPATARTGAAQETILYVGAWSLQKGCDVLIDAWRMLNGVRLLHVGPVGDLPLPAAAGFTHIPTVSQEKLTHFYGQADVFALASRQDGFGLVLSQALASGLPIVCTTMTGGSDLRDLLHCPDVVFEVPPDDPAALRDAILRALAAAKSRAGVESPAGGPRVLTGDPERLSWRRYGIQYDRQLRRIVGTTMPLSGG